MANSCDDFVMIRDFARDAAMDIVRWTLGKYPEFHWANIEPGRFDIFGESMTGFSLPLGNYQARYLSITKYPEYPFSSKGSGLYWGEKQVLSYGATHSEYLKRWQRVRP